MSAARSSLGGWLTRAALLAGLVLALFLLPAQGARGKVGFPAPTTPAPDTLAAVEQPRAAALALADARVQARVAGHRAEVLAILPVGAQLTPDSLACALSDCRLVELYDFDADVTLSAVVDLKAGLVRDVLYQPRVHPAPDQRLTDLAIQIARGSLEFSRELGRVPSAAELAPMPSGVPGTPCVGGHLCLAAVAPQGESLVWAVADVSAGHLIAVLRTPILPAAPPSGNTSPAASGCPASGAVARDGWDLRYETTPTDGFRVYAASYRGAPVLNSAKLVEWHVDYGTAGFVDEAGCASLFILPFGPSQVRDLTSGPTVVGFELVQDFRMPLWGSNCNYRYEQHDQFYSDGRFRLVGVAYGRGCSFNGLYRPLMRIDVGLGGPSSASFARWAGTGWQLQPAEGWWPQAAPYSPPGYQWRINAQNGQAYFIEPGQGQFGDGGRGDFAYLYATRHHPAEGDTDLGALGSCCADDYQQGPEQFVNGEFIAAQDLTLWYVPQMQTDVTPGQAYCWTASVSETYPCPAGPLFVPMPLAAAFEDNAPQPPGAPVVFTSRSGGVGPLDYHWDFGDGAGTSSAPRPTYAYGAAGLYTATLTVTDTTGTQSANRLVAIGFPPSASFSETISSSLSNTVLFRNGTGGSPPLTFQWDFGDTLTSTASAPRHTYRQPGLYTVSLTATNFITTTTLRQAVVVPPLLYYWPIISR